LKIAVEPLIDGPALLESPANLGLLAGVLRIVTAVASTVDYALDVSEQMEQVLEICSFYFRLSGFIAAQLGKSQGAELAEDPRNNCSLEFEGHVDNQPSRLQLSISESLRKLLDSARLQQAATTNTNVNRFVRVLDFESAKGVMMDSILRLQDEFARLGWTPPLPLAR
jgi:hypothetical protein